MGRALPPMFTTPVGNPVMYENLNRKKSKIYTLISSISLVVKKSN